MKTKRRKWRPPTEHPPDGQMVLAVVGNPGDDHPSEWLSTSEVKAGVWSYETPYVRCKVRAWAFLPKIPAVFPWERPLEHVNPERVVIPGSDGLFAIHDPLEA